MRSTTRRTRASGAPHRFTRLFFKLDDEGWTGDRRQQIYVVGADGSTEPVQLTEGDYESMSPTWSPDGEWIAFVSAREDDWDTKLVSDLFVVAAGGGDPVKITGSDGQCAFPAWSPDGALIAFFYVPGVFDDPRHAQLAVVPAKGGEHRLLSASLDRNCFPYPPIRPPAWDGDSIVFAVEDAGNNDLYRVAADSSGPTAVLRGLGVTGFDAAGGEFVYTGSTPTTFSELYLGGEPATQLTAAFTVATRAGRAGAVRRGLQGRLGGRGVDLATRRIRGRRALSSPTEHPRRAVHAVHDQVLRRVPRARRRRLRGGLLEPTRLVRLRRGVGTRDPRPRRRRAGMGQRRLRGPDGGHGRGAQPLLVLRPRPSGRPRRLLRRVHDLVDRRPHRPVQGGLLGARRQQHDRRGRLERYRDLVQGLHGRTLVRGSGDAPAGVTVHLRAEHHDAAPDRPLRGGSALPGR